MARIIEQDGYTVDIVAPRIEINWDPYSNGGSVTFYTERIERVDGKLHKRNFVGVFQHDLAPLMQRVFPVDVGEAEPVAMPAALLMQSIKSAFDALYLESIQLEAAPITDVMQPE